MRRSFYTHMIDWNTDACYMITPEDTYSAIHRRPSIVWCHSQEIHTRQKAGSWFLGLWGWGKGGGEAVGMVQWESGSRPLIKNISCLDIQSHGRTGVELPPLWVLIWLFVDLPWRPICFRPKIRVWAGKVLSFPHTERVQKRKISLVRRAWDRARDV